MKKYVIGSLIGCLLLLGSVSVFAKTNTLKVDVTEALRGFSMYFSEMETKLRRCSSATCSIEEELYDGTGALKCTGHSYDLTAIRFGFKVLPGLTKTNNAANNRNFEILFQLLANVCPAWQEQQEWIKAGIDEFAETKKDFYDTIVLDDDDIKISFMIEVNTREVMLWIEPAEK